MPGETILLDAHLLVLLVVGIYSREYIARHRRLREYSEEDYELLLDFISSASRVVVTPNTLTEASNLLGYVGEPARGQIYDAFRVFIKNGEERYIESDQAAERDEFTRLGLTDAVLLHLAEEPATLLTADLDLYLAAVRRGMKAVNFHHLRAT